LRRANTDGPMLSRVLSLVVLALSIAYPASSQDVTGGLTGRVLDDTGNPLAAVAITAQSSAMQGERSGVTDQRGYFRMVSLPVGIYSVSLRQIGFRPVQADSVAVRLGSTTSLGEFRMERSPVELPAVVVYAGRPVIDPTTTTVSTNLTDEQFATLPVERSYQSIVALLPHANTSYFGDGVNVAGGTGLENGYYIDGMHVTDPFKTRTGPSLPYNFVREVEVKSGGYEAEFSRALGGVVNVITHSGGNEFATEAFGFFRNDALTGTPRIGPVITDVTGFSEYDVGLSFSGPVVRDRLWFFTSYSTALQSRDVSVIGFGVQPDRTRSHLFAGKLTWRASERTDVTFVALGDPTRRHGIEFYQGDWLPTPSGLDDLGTVLWEQHEGGVNLSLSARHFVGDRFLVEASVSRASRTSLFQGDSEASRTQAFVVDHETNRWRGGLGEAQNAQSTRWAGSVVGTAFVGSHTIKAGLAFEDNELDLVQTLTSPGVTQRWIDETGAELYDSFYLDINGIVRHRVPSFFVQDSWLVNPYLRLNFGVRWDGLYIIGAQGSVVQTITDQWQPRAGIVVTPSAAGTDKLTASIGRFSQQLPTYISSLFPHLPLINGLAFYDQDPTAGPVDPLDELDWSAEVAPEVHGLEGQYLDEFTLGYERQVADGVKLGARGVYRVLRQAVEDGIDPESGLFVSGNPGRGALDFLPEMQREYLALELSLAGQRGPLSVLASYVLSRTHGNYTGLFDSNVNFDYPGDNHYPDLVEQIPNSTGLLPNDRRHALKLSGSYRFDWGLTAGTFVAWQSGTPLSRFGSTDWGPPWYVFLDERGTAGRTPALLDLNLRLAYNLPGLFGSTLRPKVLLDVFHIGNRRTAVYYDQIAFTGVDPNTGKQRDPNPNYLAPIQFQPPTTVRLGLVIGF